MHNFMKQNYIEVERGIEYMNYQREVAILTDFWQKTAKRSKNEEINRKKAKNYLKNQEICANFELETHQASKNPVVSFAADHISI